MDNLQNMIYLSALNQLNEAYDKAEYLGDTELMLNISLEMEKLISENDTNEVARIIYWRLEVNLIHLLLMHWTFGFSECD